MSFRSWLYVSTLGLIVAGSNAWPQAAPEDQPGEKESATTGDSNSASQDAQPIDFSPALKGIESAIRELIAEEDTIETERKQSQETRDLMAQEGMAWWAEWMFYAAAATVILTFVALFAIIRTLHHTRRAADYTRDMLVEARATTNAAKETVKSSREIGEAQARAYCSVSDVKIAFIKGKGKLSMNAKNSGNSPADTITVSSEVHIAPLSEKKVVTDLSRRVPDDATRFPILDIARGGAQRVNFDCPIIGEADGRRTGVAVNVLVRLNYNDIFGSPIVKNYVGILAGNGGILESGKPCEVLMFSADINEATN